MPTPPPLFPNDSDESTKDQSAQRPRSQARRGFGARVWVDAAVVVLVVAAIALWAKSHEKPLESPEDLESPEYLGRKYREYQEELLKQLEKPHETPENLEYYLSLSDREFREFLQENKENQRLSMRELDAISQARGQRELERWKEDTRDYHVIAIDIGGGVTLEMVDCSRPCLLFSSSSEKWDLDIWMGKYEVTQHQWYWVMKENPSYFRFKDLQMPVEQVSWDECQEFVKKLNAIPSVKASGLTFRLPTAYEWIKACRAGAGPSVPYCWLGVGWGDVKTAEMLSYTAYYGKDWEDGPQVVGRLRPNALGLYDMLGNVQEWTATADGSDGETRVTCGGSFFGNANSCRTDLPLFGTTLPSECNRFTGLRLAATGKVRWKDKEKWEAQ